jgi:hypothetical protein
MVTSFVGSRTKGRCASTVLGCVCAVVDDEKTVVAIIAVTATCQNFFIF